MKKPFDPNAILRKLADKPSQTGDFVIRKDGSWWHQGGKIGRPKLVALFASILHRQADGRHWLVTSYEQHEVEVEGAALRIVAVESGSDAIVARAQTGEICRIDAEHGLSMRDCDGEMVPHMQWMRGLDAMFERAAYYDLVELGEVEGGRLIIGSAGASFDLGPVE